MSRATLILVLFALWGMLSWYWYTCDIKGFCGATTQEQEVVDDENGIVLDENGQPISCEPAITDSLRLGWKNPEEQVRLLETFLNETEGETLEVDGFYGQDNADAVSRFQVKYAEDILAPYGITEPSGFFHTETLEKFNELHCAQNVPAPEDQEERTLFF